MSDQVQFDEDQIGLPRNRGSRAIPGGSFSSTGQFQRPGAASGGGMTGWLVRHGITSGDGGAKVLLIGIMSINFIAAGLIIYFFVLH